MHGHSETSEFIHLGTVCMDMNKQAKAKTTFEATYNNNIYVYMNLQLPQDFGRNLGGQKTLLQLF
jgi:hypothetical protein